MRFSIEDIKKFNIDTSRLSIEDAKKLNLDNEIISIKNQGEKGKRKILQLDEKGRNKTEARFADHYLDYLKKSDSIIDYAFEPITFRLVARTTLRIDYVIKLKNGNFAFIDIKGNKNFIEDDAAVKLKTAAFLFEVLFGKFYIVCWQNGSWKFYPVTKKSGICNYDIGDKWLEL